MERITFNPEQCGGRPCIRGMRIRVKDVLDLLAAGVSEPEILADYPYLEAKTYALAWRTRLKKRIIRSWLQPVSEYSDRCAIAAGTCLAAHRRWSPGPPRRRSRTARCDGSSRVGPRGLRRRCYLHQGRGFRSFRRLRAQTGPTVVWLRVGNSSNLALQRWLMPLLSEVERMVAAGETLIEVR